MQVRGLAARLNASGKYRYKPPEGVVDHLVIGGGVVGLAIARRLALRYPHKSTYLVERHARAGQETSSRNSEVVHAGIYYPADSLKTRLCLRGRDLLYAYCRAAHVPFRQLGKLVVARGDQVAYIERLHAHAQSLPSAWPTRRRPDADTGVFPEEQIAPNSASATAPAVPTELLSGAEARAREPDLSADIAAALWSPATGIIDAHGLMAALETDITGSGGGALAYATRVVRVDPHTAPGEAGWVVQTVTGDSASDGEAGDALLARTLINASGLSAPLVLNALLPASARIPLYYARGSYAAYRGPGVSRVSRLLYPCPKNTGAKGHAFHSLGTHLTLDLAGSVRFGPDLEWINAPEGAAGKADGADEIDPDFWTQHLSPDASESQLAEMHRAVARYLPGVALGGLRPDYAGIRPKLVAPPASGFQDFVFRKDLPHALAPGSASTVPGKRPEGPMVTLLGIESPGLTASLAIAEMVVDEMLQGA